MLTVASPNHDLELLSVSVGRTTSLSVVGRIGGRHGLTEKSAADDDVGGGVGASFAHREGRVTLEVDVDFVEDQL